MRYSGILVAGSVVLALLFSGCRVQVDQDANGQEKKVQVDTPFGGVHVNTDQITASDLGLSVYPGAKLDRNKSDHESADVHIGFGEWQIRVRAVSYSTPDNREKVIAFYKKALSRYGDVLTCKNGVAVGSPAVTAEGLTCADDDKNGKLKIDSKDVDIHQDFQLRAGSRRRQHILGIDSADSGATRFSLVALDLPTSSGSEDKKRD